MSLNENEGVTTCIKCGHPRSTDENDLCQTCAAFAAWVARKMRRNMAGHK